MPAKSPSIAAALTAQLHALGGCIRVHRKLQKVSAAAAAEAAGMSRVTLHRIERGEPSVTLGAYASAIEAVGLQLLIIDPRAPRPVAGPEPRVAAPASGLPQPVQLAHYPQLQQLAWQRSGRAELSPAEALSLYERNWRHVDTATLQPQERALIEALAAELPGGRLLV